MTYGGEVFSIPRLVGLRTKEITAKLGKADTLRDVSATQAHIAATVAPRLEKLLEITRDAKARELKPLHERA